MIYVYDVGFTQAKRYEGSHERGDAGCGCFFRKYRYNQGMPRSPETLDYLLKQQGEQQKESHPYYLVSLVSTIEAAPNTVPILGLTVDFRTASDYMLKAIIHQINGKLVLPEDAQQISQLVERQPALGFVIESDQLRLQPVDPSNLPFTPGLLMHQGYVRGYDFANRPIDNQQNLARYGVFGAPDLAKLTYLQVFNTERSVAPNVNHRIITSDPVWLYVDAAVLAEYRSLYPDPEGLDRKSVV